MNKFLDCALEFLATVQMDSWVKPVTLTVHMDLTLGLPVVQMVLGSPTQFVKETSGRPKMDVMGVLDPWVDLGTEPLNLFWELNLKTQQDLRTLETAA